MKTSLGLLLAACTWCVRTYSSSVEEEIDVFFRRFFLCRFHVSHRKLALHAVIARSYYSVVSVMDIERESSLMRYRHTKIYQVLY